MARKWPSLLPATQVDAIDRHTAKPPRIRWDNKPARKKGPSGPTNNPLPREEGEERIAKLLARAGVASRREIERMIADARITLNGETVEKPATLLKNLDGVSVDGKPVGKPAPTTLYLFNKPEGCLDRRARFFGAQNDLRSVAARIAPRDADRTA